MMNTGMTAGEPAKEMLELIVRNPKNPLYHPFNFLAREYGNDVEKLLKRLNSILALGLGTRFVKNKKLKTVLRGLQIGLAAGLMGSEFAMKIRNYIRFVADSKEDDPYHKRMKRACKLLQIEEDDPDYGSVNHQEFTIGSELAKWIVQRPRTEKIKIKGYYNMSNLEEMNDIAFETGKDFSVGTLFEIDNQLFLLDLTFLTTILGTTLVKMSFCLGKTVNSEKMYEIRKALLYDYVQNLDTKNNIIRFDGWGSIYTSARRQVKENINQFDIARLRREIRSVLRHKRKRAFAFVGKQGVGKSSILRVIEETMREYMVVHLTADDFEYARTVRDRFDIAKQFQPLIIMIEDLDSCGLREKGSRTGAFLECIDEVNDDLNMVILVTINDTSLIHRTILDRPGRFDRVFEITPPKTVDEVYQVFDSKLNHIKHNYCNGTEVSLLDKDIMGKVLKRCVDEKFTQAELTNAISEQALIDMDVELEGSKAKNPWRSICPQDFMPFLEGAVEKHCETKKAIKEYKFNDMDPDMDPDMNTQTSDGCCESKVSRAYGDYPS